VFLERWLCDGETWGRRSRKEVGTAVEYILSYKSKWNEWQPTCTINWSWILQRIGAWSIAAGDTNGPAFSISWSDDVCLFTGIHRDGRPLISHDWLILKEYSAIERTLGDICLKASLWSDLNHTLTLKSSCTVSMAIPNQVTVKTLILLCSKWLNLPTLT
jgi:hypothetical protein